MAPTAAIKTPDTLESRHPESIYRPLARRRLAAKNIKHCIDAAIVPGDIEIRGQANGPGEKGKFTLFDSRFYVPAKGAACRAPRRGANIKGFRITRRKWRKRDAIEQGIGCIRKPFIGAMTRRGLAIVAACTPDKILAEPYRDGRIEIIFVQAQCECRDTSTIEDAVVMDRRRESADGAAVCKRHIHIHAASQ